MKYIFYLTFLLFFACKSNQTRKSLVTNFGLAQGTSYSIKYISSDGNDYQNQLDSLFTVVDASMSTYLETSLISRLNVGESFLKVDSHFIKVFKASQEIAEQTSGQFDCTVAPLVHSWGFGTDKNIIPPDSLQVLNILQSVGYEKVGLIGDSLIDKPLTMRLDFNAIAQGYSVDLMAEFLESKGITDYLIEIGGEIRANGLNQRGQEWLIGIDKPSSQIDKSDRFQVKLRLNNQSLATSGNYRNFYEKDGRFFSHTISPKTGYPVQHNLLSATVVADNAMTADAFATAFMVMGVKQTQQFIQKRTDLDVFLVYTDENNQWVNWFSDGLEECLLK